MADFTRKDVVVQAAVCLRDAGLQSRVFAPSTPEYDSCKDSYWSCTAKLTPTCVVRPRSAAEVSVALKALVRANEKFAVRSTGHAPSPGVNNIDGGVTMDLSLLDSVQYDETSETVSFGPGARWLRVYQELQKHGRIVTGGREGQNGVAGFLLGGGNNWLMSTRGWACDNVITYETVLADGIIVAADRDTHPDLFRALKGGGNNFGVVTRFTMNTISCERIWGGVATSSKEYVSDAIQLASNFTKSLHSYPDSSLVVLIGYIPDMKDIAVVTGVVETRGLEKVPIFDEWEKLPKITNTAKPKTMLEIGTETSQACDRYNTWFTLTIKNDQGIMAKVAELHERLVEELKPLIPAGDFGTQCVFGPLPALVGKRSVAAGGNVMGLERIAGDGILVQMNTMAKTAEHMALIYPRQKAWVEAVRAHAAKDDGGGGDLGWLFMNYADSSQDVLASYGAENVKFMKEVSAKYDPQGVFQTLCPGGWKVSEVSL
ncbi:hypothetical protein F4775DRAFT_585408 [Biscogniauxia sp. FL1348]|nr:hypothetical protein F4775DRAFT_585408 [Biscogniauxia sp. FL1348]